MDWRQINSIADWKNLLHENERSSTNVAAIFKHSIRCPISAMVKMRVENTWSKENPNIPIYLVDLINNRELSDQIALSLDVIHESPQLILLKEGRQVYNASHTAINSRDIANYI